MRRIGAIAGLACALWLPAQAHEKPQVTKLEGDPAKAILWVGNSFFYYNNGMSNMYSGMSKAAGDETRVTLAAIGGSGIDWHDVDSYLKPGSKIGYYSIINNKARLNPPGRQYDTMIVMDCSQCPIHPELSKVFHEYTKIDADIARKYNVRPVFFMSWAYKDRPEMTEELAEAYTREGNANGALVVPAGLAFARAIKLRPDLEFYQPDKRHPQKIGSYLAMCTVYAAITGKSPVGNSYTDGIDAELAKFLQQVAWDTVQEYYGHPGDAPRTQ
jgi:hypothetical protein